MGSLNTYQSYTCCMAPKDVYRWFRCRVVKFHHFLYVHVLIYIYIYPRSLPQMVNLCRNVKAPLANPRTYRKMAWQMGTETTQAESRPYQITHLGSRLYLLWDIMQKNNNQLMTSTCCKRLPCRGCYHLVKGRFLCISTHTDTSVASYYACWDLVKASR